MDEISSIFPAVSAPYTHFIRYQAEDEIERQSTRPRLDL